MAVKGVIFTLFYSESALIAVLNFHELNRDAGQPVRFRVYILRICKYDSETGLTTWARPLVTSIKSSSQVLFTAIADP